MVMRAVELLDEIPQVGRIYKITFKKNNNSEKYNI